MRVEPRSWRRASPSAWLLLMPGLALAQSAGPHDLSWWTTDNGGGSAAGGVYTLSGTIAQPDAAAVASGGPYAFSPGFWPGVQSPGPRPDALFADNFEN